MSSENNMLTEKGLLEKQATRILELEKQITDLQSDLAVTRAGASRLQLVADLFALSSEAVVLLREDLSVYYVSDVMSDITGRETSEFQDRIFSDLLVGDGQEQLFREIGRAMNDLGFWSGELWIQAHSNTRKRLAIDLYRLDDQEEPEAVFGALLRDVTQQKEHEEELWHKSRYDQLTNLPNWNLFLNHFVQSLFISAETGTLTAFLFIDLDGFKLINDTLGHTIGDKVLEQAARAFSDALPEQASLARFSGDEFVAVLPQMQGQVEAETLALSLQQAIERPFWIEEDEIHLSCSVGISVYPGDGDDLETLIRNADAAMHKAKADGRRCVRFFEKELDSRAQARRVLEVRLRNALSEDQLTMSYQPIVDANTSQLVKAEALMRWRDSEIGIVSPGQFVPLAEETGMIRALGEVALRKSIAAAAAWQHGAGKGVGVSVNVSAQQIEIDGLAELVDRELAKTGLDPALLTLEITESTILNESDDTLQKLQNLHQLGVSLAIDDFGTGYSSLSYLRKFDLDYVKIDQSFIRDIISNAEDASMASAIISMALKLDMVCIAEGVETLAQQEFLQREGCHQLQGYLYSRPLGEASFRDYLRQRVG